MKREHVIISRKDFEGMAKQFKDTPINEVWLPISKRRYRKISKRRHRKTKS